MVGRRENPVGGGIAAGIVLAQPVAAFAGQKAVRVVGEPALDWAQGFHHALAQLRRARLDRRARDRVTAVDGIEGHQCRHFFRVVER